MYTQSQKKRSFSFFVLEVKIAYPCFISRLEMDAKAAQGHTYAYLITTFEEWVLFAVLLCVFVLFCCLSVIPLILIRNVEVNEASWGYIEGIICQRAEE